MSSQQHLIRNCRFAFRCHQRWDSLETTEQRRIRYCHECSREVVLCTQDDELKAALRADQCVAIPGPGPLVGHTIGDVMHPGDRPE